jgi:hypothetical protein
MKIVSILIVFLFLSCSKAPYESDMILSYPLETGTVWEYSRTMSEVNFRPSIPGASFRETTYISSGYVRVIGEKIFYDTVRTKQVLEVSHGLQTVGSEKYYLEKPEALYLYGYKGGNTFTPKTSNSVGYKFKGIQFNNPHEILKYLERLQGGPNKKLLDSVTIEPIPLIVYKFPIEVGSQWNYCKRITNVPFLIDKKVVGTELVHLPIGVFNTYVIRWLYDLNDDNAYDTNFEFYDYVCEEGLIKREIILKDLTVTTAESPEGIGLVDYKDVTLVTNIVIN